VEDKECDNIPRVIRYKRERGGTSRFFADIAGYHAKKTKN
jgi:hypothetical protein